MVRSGQFRRFVSRAELQGPRARAGGWHGGLRAGTEGRARRRQRTRVHLAIARAFKQGGNDHSGGEIVEGWKQRRGGVPLRVLGSPEGRENSTGLPNEVEWGVIVPGRARATPRYTFGVMMTGNRAGGGGEWGIGPTRRRRQSIPTLLLPSSQGTADFIFHRAGAGRLNPINSAVFMDMHGNVLRNGCAGLVGFRIICGQGPTSDPLHSSEASGPCVRWAGRLAQRPRSLRALRVVPGGDRVPLRGSGT